MSRFIAHRSVLIVATAGVLGVHSNVSAATAGVPSIPSVAAASVEYLAQQRIKLGEPDTGDLRSRIRDDLATQRLLAAQATRVGLETSADVKAQIELNQLAVLSKAYLDEYFRRHPVTDDEVAADYEARRKAGEIREYRVRHLSVTDEQQARDLLRKLDEGTDLAELARANSTDPSAETNGGDIGWFRPDLFVDERFGAAVAALKKGETTTTPVKTRFGWHIIRVEDGPRRVAELPAYKDVKPELQKVMREKMMKRALQSHIAELKRAAAGVQGADVTRVSRLP